MDKVLGLDIGEKRVGVALGSKETKFASPLETISNDEALFTKLEKIVNENNVDLIVSGLPINSNGEDTMQTEYTRKVAEEIRSRLNINLVFQDESFTSVKAREELESSKKPYQKGDVDKLAACYILEDYLMGIN
jgi:putative Holliday junction resolvase